MFMLSNCREFASLIYELAAIGRKLLGLMSLL